MATFNTPKFTVNAIRQFVDDVINNTSNYYVGVGRPQPWGVNDTPTVTFDTPVNQNQTIRDTVLLARINPSNVAYGAKRHDWVSGNVYDQYDDQISPSNPSYSGATSIANAVFYVLTPQMNVYKCLWNNNNGQSTIEPTGTPIGLIQTGDGYIWKYMFTIPPSLQNSFLSASIIPVIRATQQNFYSGGSIESVTINNPGSGYSTASLSVTGNGTASTNPYRIQSLSIATSGFGYPSAPIITISPPILPQGQTATGTCTIDASGRVNSIALSVSGYNYNSAPTVTVSSPVSGYSIWQPSTVVYTNQILENNGYFYQVTSAGTTGTTPPTLTTPLGTITDGTAVIELIAIQAVIDVVGYYAQATLVPILTNGQITAVQIIDPGVGYTWATITVTGSGQNAQLVPNLSVGDLTTQQSSVEITAIKGAISAITLTNPGSGYSTATVAISGDGSGATATPIISNGQISSIQITNYGSGYTWATATIYGNGVNATCRVILAPYNGHGYNAIEELYCQYALVSIPINPAYKSLTLNNTYRQISLFRNVCVYGTQQTYLLQDGIVCYTINASINTTNFTQGQTLTDQSGLGQYYVMNITATSAVLLALNHIAPYNGQILANGNNNTLVVQSVVNPDIDPFSGELLQYNYYNPFNVSSTNFVTFNCNILY